MFSIIIYNQKQKLSSQSLAKSQMVPTDQQNYPVLKLKWLPTAACDL